MARIPDDAWATIVEHSPLVSVDLIVRQSGGVLGTRTNEPLKGEMFVPRGPVSAADDQHAVRVAHLRTEDAHHSRSLSRRPRMGLTLDRSRPR